MSWRISIAVASSLPSLVLPGAPGTAWADEAFLCGPDAVVYVATEDLEQKKHTDPCIAKYFGLEVDRADTSQASAAPGNVATRGFKSAEPENAQSAPQRLAELLAPKAAPGTDYRNVLVLNALSENSKWFHHTR